jgi:hypothetical protein
LCAGCHWLARCLWTLELPNCYVRLHIFLKGQWSEVYSCTSYPRWLLRTSKKNKQNKNWMLDKQLKTVTQSYKSSCKRIPSEF